MTERIEHTPGPWGVTTDRGWRSHSCCYDYAITGYESGQKFTVAEVLDDADAHLIAAAPDLLAFLKATREQLYCDYTKLDALIAKAEGEKSAPAAACPIPK